MKHKFLYLIAAIALVSGCSIGPKLSKVDAQHKEGQIHWQFQDGSLCELNVVGALHFYLSADGKWKTTLMSKSLSDSGRYAWQSKIGIGFVKDNELIKKKTLHMPPFLVDSTKIEKKEFTGTSDGVDDELFLALETSSVELVLIHNCEIVDERNNLVEL